MLGSKQYQNIFTQFYQNDFFKEVNEIQKKLISMINLNHIQMKDLFLNNKINDLKDFEKFFNNEDFLKNLNDSKEIYFDNLDKFMNFSQENKNKSEKTIKSYEDLIKKLNQQIMTGLEKKEIKEVLAAFTDYSKEINLINVELMKNVLKK